MTADTVRLSRHFVLLDFLYDRDVYTYRQPIALADIWNDEHEEMGLALAQRLLEPAILRYGPCSISAGFWPPGVQAPGGHYDKSPHLWTREVGAAADVVWHDWVNADKSPISLVCNLESNGVARFERMISYAGSEFLCMATKGTERQRAAVYENRRAGRGQHQRIVHSPRARHTAYKEGRCFSPEHQWRRLHGEPVHSTSQAVRPQHVRVGQYFTFLDMCHNACGAERGVRTVPEVTDREAIAASRMFAEVMDPMVALHGRVSVIRGIESPRHTEEPQRMWVHQLEVREPLTINFLLPQGADEEAAMDVLEQHPEVVEILSFDHPSDACEIELTIRPYEVAHYWSSSRDLSQ
jgi:hypothetical protein